MFRRTRSLLALVATATAAAAIVLPMDVASAAATGGGTSWRINLSQTGGVDFDKPSTRARISADGQRACYQSPAKNVVAGDTTFQDIFWTDFSNPAAPKTELVSSGINAQGQKVAANGDSNFCEISGNGNLVIFSSSATNLVQGTTGRGVFVRNMTTKVTKRIAAGAERPVISDDGRMVAYNTVAPSNAVFAAELNAQLALVRTPLRVTPDAPAGTDVESLRPEISANGNFLIFASDLKLIPAKDTNAERDVYRVSLVNWRTTGSTALTYDLASVDKNGNAAGRTSSRPGINGTGSVVSFESSSGNIANAPTGNAPDTNGQTDAFVRDYRVSPPVTRLVSYRKDGTLGASVGSRPQLDSSGNVVAFVSTAAQIVSADTNNKEDAFLRNWSAEQGANLTVATNRHTYLLAVAPNGDSGVCPGIAGVDEGTKAISTRPYLSNDGRTAIFVTGDCNLANDSAHGGPDRNLLADIYVRRYPTTI